MTNKGHRENRSDQTTVHIQGNDNIELIIGITQLTQCLGIFSS